MQTLEAALVGHVTNNLVTLEQACARLPGSETLQAMAAARRTSTQ
jgi:hypothetical protein